VKGRRIGGDFRIVARQYLRNPLALFFSLIFPIILILLFGAIFSGGSTTTSLAVENLDHNSHASQAFLAALNNTTLVSITLVNYNVSQFGADLGNNGYTTGLIIPAGFQDDYLNHTPVNLTVYTDPEDASAAGVAVSAVSAVATAFNLQAACSTSHCGPVVGFQTANVGQAVYTYIDYLIPGLIGFSILTSPMFSMVDIASSYRKDGIFRQLSLTPLTKAEWLTSRIAWYILLTFVTAGIMIAAGVGGFHAHVEITLGLVPFLVVGPFFFVSLGMLAGTVTRTPETAALIGNIVTFPMMFLSGTFFPVSDFPPYLADFAHVLPLYYVIDGMNQVMLFSNATRAATDLAIVLVAGIVVFLLAVRFFKWRDE
jgi:ABC-2 type transport system permease protein